MTNAPVPWSVRSVLVSVHDLDRSLAFYRDVVGLRETTREDELAVLEGEHRTFAIVLREERGEAFHYGQQALGPRAITLDVGSHDELDGVAKRLEAAGAIVSRTPLDASEPYDVVTGRDPDGLPLVFVADDGSAPHNADHDLHVARRMYGIDV